MEERESRGIMPISKLNQISTPKRNQAGQRTCTQHKRQAQRGAEQQSRGSAPQPMEVDPSLSRFRQPAQTSNDANKRPATSERTNARYKNQRVNHVTQGAGQAAELYAAAASAAMAQINDDGESDSDALHFLGVNPCYPSSGEE